MSYKISYPNEKFGSRICIVGEPDINVESLKLIEEYCTLSGIEIVWVGDNVTLEKYGHGYCPTGHEYWYHELKNEVKQLKLDNNNKHNYPWWYKGYK